MKLERSLVCLWLWLSCWWPVAGAEPAPEAVVAPMPELRDLRTTSGESAGFALEGSRVIAWTMDQRLGMWDAGSGKPVETEFSKPIMWGSHVLDGRKQRAFVASGEAGERRGMVYDLATGRAVSPAIKCETSVAGGHLPAIFTPDGAAIVLGTAEGGYRITKVESGQVLGSIAVPGTVIEDMVQLLPPQFTADGKFAFIMDGKGTLRRYATETWREAGPAMARTKGMVDGEWGFAVQRGGSWAASFSQIGDCGGVGTLQFWSTADGQALGAPVEGDWGISARFIGSGTRVIVQPSRGETRIINLRRPQYQVVLPLHDDVSASNALVCSGGSAVLSWANDGKLTRTPLERESKEKQVTYESAGRIAQVIEGPERESVYAVVVPPAGRKKEDEPKLESHLVKLDARTLEKKAALRLESEYADYCKIEFSPDGSRILLGDGRVKLIATEVMEEMEVTKRDGS